jgi:hypothetical protein
VSAADVRDALHRARAAINDAELMTTAEEATEGLTPSGPPEVTVDDIVAAIEAADEAYAAGRGRMEAALVAYAARHAVPRPAALCYCATGRGEPTQADGLRAAARLVEMVGDAAELAVGVSYNYPYVVDAQVTYDRYTDDLAAQDVSRLARLRAVAARLSLAPAERHPGRVASSVYVELATTVDGVPASAWALITTPAGVAEARAWIAEVAS